MPTPFSGLPRHLIVSPDLQQPATMRFISSLGLGTVEQVTLLKEQMGPLGGCYWNVEACKSIDGGDIVFGWKVTWVQGFFIQAIHHAVWGKNGNLFEVTESASYSSVFVRDPAPLNYKAGERFAKKIEPLSSSPAARRAVDLDRLQDKLHVESAKVGDLSSRLAAEAKINSFRATWRAAESDALHEMSKGNEPCLCGSGRKYKKCHARP